MSEIRVDTIAEKTSANGVSIDSVTLKDGGVTGTAAIVAGGGNGPTLGFQLKDTSGNAQPRLTNDANNDTVIRPGASGRQIMLANYANNATAVNVDDSGHVTMPLQPAFNALVGSTQTFNNNTNTTVVFVTERYDTNGDFASNTFTAPVNGKYLLSYGIYFMDVDTDMVYVQNEITTSNRTYYNAFSTTGFDATNQYWNLNQTVVADMDANDTAVVKVYFNAGSALRADGSSFFSGALLS